MQIELDQYEAANLLWLLRDVIGWGAPGITPFTFAHTGDWTGQIALKLLQNGEIHYRPNVSVEDMKRRVNLWLEKEANR